MLPEYLAEKNTLLAALESAAENLAGRVTVYALLEGDDAAFPFTLKWVMRPGNVTADSILINQRLFDRAFLDYGYHEVRGEDNIEGVEYKPLDDMLTDPDCIGVAPVERFDTDRARVRMAAGADEDPDDADDPQTARFVAFLDAVREGALSGEVDEKVGFEDVPNVKGLVFKYGCDIDGAPAQLIAFQRVQPMWVAKKSSFLLFGRDADVEMFADRSIKIGTAFDFVLFGQTLLFGSLKALETLFGYRKLIAAAALDYADSLGDLVADYEKLEERIQESRAVANRLIKIQSSDSPVPDMSAEDLEFRLNRIPYYNGKLKLNEEGKVMMTTNVEVSDFLKLLDDGFLVSPLTEASYEARSKKRVDS